MRRLLTFGFFGGLATLVHFAVATTIFRLASGHIFLANLAGFMVAFAVSYLGHYHFTFRSSASHGAAMPRFLATALAGLAINNGVLALTVLATGRQSIAGLAVAIVFAAACVYVISRRWAFAS